MNQTPETEFWLSGPLENIPSLLQPVAHALLQAKREVSKLMQNFPEEKLWQMPAGVASVGFHLQHLTGVLNRLFTYAKNEKLSTGQLNYLSAEGRRNDSITLQALLTNFNDQIDISLHELSNTSEASLKEYRSVGRKELPSTVMGLLFHSAEHTMRHLGQLLVTVKIVKA